MRVFAVGHNRDVLHGAAVALVVNPAPITGSARLQQDINQLGLMIPSHVNDFISSIVYYLFCLDSVISQ